MRRVLILLVPVLAVAITGCGSSSTSGSSSVGQNDPAQDLIVGKWQVLDKDGKDGSGIIAFAADGKFIISGARNGGANGTYKFVSADSIELYIENPSTKQIVTQKMKIAVNKDELTVTSEKGKTNKHRRIK